jgi:hypothetical protein
MPWDGGIWGRAGATCLLVGCVAFVSACGGPSNSQSSVGGQGPCGAPLLNGSAPKVVVVVLDGVGSEEAGGEFDPLPASSTSTFDYCPLDANRHERGWPEGLNDALRRWSEFKVSGGSSGGSSSPNSSKACDWPGVGTDSCLVGELAHAGAVILPYSYASGTGVTQAGGQVTFTMTAYTTDDTKQPIGDSVANLDGELRSLHTVWPGTPIVLVGHSYGGLVAEEWWEEAWSDGAHLGVTNVFSLDSPINGVFQCKGSAVIQGGNVSDEFCRRRASLTGDRAIDSNIIHLASDGSYTAVGNVEDPTYSGVLSGAGGGIEDQVVYKCAPGGDTNTACVAQPPSLLINADASNTVCNEGSAALWGTTGHDIVKACPFVVDAIVHAVDEAAAAAPSSPATTTPTTTTQPQSPEQQARLAAVGHWLDLMNATHSSHISKDYNQVNGRQVLSTRLLVGDANPSSVLTAIEMAAAGSMPSFTFHFRYTAPELVSAPKQPLGLGFIPAATTTGDVQLRVVALEDSPGELSPADTANGISFRGPVSIKIVNHWRPHSGAPFSRFTDYKYTVEITLQNGHSQFSATEYEGSWVSGGFDGIEYPADVPIAVACQLSEVGKEFPDYAGQRPPECRPGG